MAARNLLVVLTEISDTSSAIESAVRGKTERSLDEDWLLKHGIERGLEIISEAARHLPDDLLADAPEVPWKQVRGIGNVLRHEYHRIANPVIWAVVTDQLPPLRAAVDRLKDRLPDSRFPTISPVPSCSMRRGRRSYTPRQGSDS